MDEVCCFLIGIESSSLATTKISPRLTYLLCLFCIQINRRQGAAKRYLEPCPGLTHIIVGSDMVSSSDAEKLSKVGCASYLACGKNTEASADCFTHFFRYCPSSGRLR